MTIAGAGLTDDFHWFAMRVRPLKELLAGIALTRMGIEHVVPVRLVRGRRRSRHVKTRLPPTQIPALPGFVFIRTSDGHLAGDAHRARTCPFIGKLVLMNGKPAVLPNAWLDRLNPAALDPEHLQPSPVKIGDAVRLTEHAGAFAGLTGRAASEAKQGEIRVLIEFFNSLREVSLPVYHIKAAA